jgi:hypothetical protein
MIMSPRRRTITSHAHSTRPRPHPGATLPAIAQAPKHSQRSEKARDWHLLFDGKTSTGWRGGHSSTFPATGWKVKDGMISTRPEIRT